MHFGEKAGQKNRGVVYMLKKIIIKNFKCFKNETVLDLRKTNYKFLEQNTYGKILKGALFVGDHGSGKTTVLQTVRMLTEFLLREREWETASYQCAYSKEGAVSLTYEFEIDGHELAYFFTFSGNSFLEENLRIDGRTVIERLGKKSKWLTGKETILCDVEDSSLFLRYISLKTEFFDDEILVKWFSYLKKTVYIDTYSRRIATFDGESLSAKKYVEAHGTEKINEFLRTHHFPYLVREDLFLEREGVDMRIPLDMESSGNRTLLNILPAFLNLAERGGLLLIDQFGDNLHNRLEELLVRYAMRQDIAAQLFLTSHSTNLLSNSLLRPDQIFSVEMSGSEGSRLHRFSDQQPRVAQNLEKMYLSGTFGGLPEYKTEDLSTTLVKNGR